MAEVGSFTVEVENPRAVTWGRWSEMFQTPYESADASRRNT